MSIFTKILIGLVILATLPVIYFAAGVLNVQGAWRAKVIDFEKKIVDTKNKNKELEFGNAAAQNTPYVPGLSYPEDYKPGVKQLETARNNLLLNTGRVWYATCTLPSVSPDTGSLKIKLYNTDVHITDFTSAPESGGRGALKLAAGADGTPVPPIADKTELFIFQMAHNGEMDATKDRYVGEFVVDGPSDENVSLKPARPMSPAQWDLILNETKSPQWVVYDKMPVDTHDVFTGLSEKQIRDRVPDSVAIEYLFDRRKPSAEILADPELAKLVDDAKPTDSGLFMRPLRDYGLIFRDGRDRLEKMSDELRTLNNDLEFAKRGKETLDKIKLIQEAKALRLAEEKKLVSAELMVVKEQSEKLAVAVEDMKQELVRLLAEAKRRKGPPPVNGKTAAIPAPDAGAALEAR